MTMTPRERVLAAIHGEPVDRVPIALWRHFPHVDTAADGLAAAVVGYQREHGFDIVKVTPASGYPAEAWGAELVPTDNTEGTRTYVRRVVEAPGDWRGVRPIAPDDAVLARELHAVRLVREGVGHDIHVMPTVFSPLTIAKQLAGKERMLEHLRESPDHVHAALAVIAESMAAFAAACLDEGADGIFFATQFARHDEPGPEAYAAFGEPYDLQVLDGLRGREALLLVHLCGNRPMLAVAIGYGADIINWHDQVTPPTLAEARSRWSGGAVLGGIDRDELVTGTPAEVRASVRDAVTATGGRRLILGAGCVTLVNTPEANIRAARGAVENG